MDSNLKKVFPISHKFYELFHLQIEGIKERIPQKKQHFWRKVKSSKTAQKMKFSIKDFFRKCEKIHRKNCSFKKENYNLEIISGNQNPISRYLKVNFKCKKGTEFWLVRSEFWEFHEQNCPKDNNNL